MRRRGHALGRLSVPVCDVQDVFVRWSTLRAWGSRTFDRVKLVVRPHLPDLGFIGFARQDGRQGRWKIVVHDTGSRAEVLATLLHEMAHVATWSDCRHGSKWRTAYLDAVAEATGHVPLLSEGPVSVVRLDEEAARCVAGWLGARLRVGDLDTAGGFRQDGRG